MTDVAMTPTAGRFVGQAVLRKEDPRLLTGRGRYTDDVSLPRMLHAHFVRSDIARARITRLDVDAARQADGVVAVFTGADLNPKLAGTMLPSMFVAGADFAAPVVPLAETDVRFVGDPVVLIIARSRYLAEDAAELVEIEYDPLVPILDWDIAAGDAENRVHENRFSNVAMQMAVPLGPEQQAAHDAAAYHVTESFVQHRYSTVPMETRGVVARWEPFDRRLDIWMSSQNPHEARRQFSRVTGVPEHQIRVQIGDVGGGFGLKSFVGREELVIGLVARVMNATVKWIEDRRENLIASSHAREDRVTATMAVAEDGTIVGATMDHLDDGGAYPMGGGGGGPLVGMLYSGPYRFGHLAWSTTQVWTNTCGKGAYRGPWMMETTAREQMMDATARAIGMDPLELRRKNVLHRAELPYTSAAGMLIENVSPEECLEQAAAAIAYDDFREQQADAAAQGRYLGVGFSLYLEPQFGVAVFENEPAHIRMHPDGRVDVFLGSGAHGQGLETTTAQLAAEFLGIHVDDVTVHQGDTEGTPFGPGTGGSHSGPMIGAAVQEAALLLKDKLVAIAAHMLEAANEDLEVEDGVVSVAGTPSKSVTIQEITQKAYADPGSLPAELDRTLEVMHRYHAPRSMWSNACHAVTVALDVNTGMVEILRYVVAEDCGVMINPNIVDGQVHGGVAQGIGGVLYEHNVYDDDGNPLASTFMDYLLPTAHEVPTIETIHLETPAATTGGYKGVGEGGAIGAPAAVFNAVADALALLGATVRDQPLDPETVLAAIHAARG